MQLLECSGNQVNPDPNFIWTNMLCQRQISLFLLRLCFFNLDLVVILKKKKKDLEMARSTSQLISQEIEKKKIYLLF